MNNISKWKLINGGWPGPWVIYEDRVKKFIEVNKLKPISNESLQARELEGKSNIEVKSQVNPIYIIDPRGGMRNPHLHYRGKIYLLDSKQWNKFSGELVREFSKKLAEANSVTFEQLVELSDTTAGIV